MVSPLPDIDWKTQHSCQEGKGRTVRQPLEPTLRSSVKAEPIQANGRVEYPHAVFLQEVQSRMKAQGSVESLKTQGVSPHRASALKAVVRECTL